MLCLLWWLVVALVVALVAALVAARVVALVVAVAGPARALQYELVLNLHVC